MIRWLLGEDRPGLETADLLHPQERAEGERYRRPQRRRQWLLGRATTKALLLGCGPALGLPTLTPAALCIRRTPEGWPEATDATGRVLDVSLSISHTGPRALAAACPAAEGEVGVDLERVEPRHPALLEDHFDPLERRWLLALPESVRHRMITVFWALKEATLKARRTGLRRPAASVRVRRAAGGRHGSWLRADVVDADLGPVEAYWRLDDDDLALAVVRLAGGATSLARTG